MKNVLGFEGYPCKNYFAYSFVTFLHFRLRNGLGKYALWVYVEKYLNIAICFRISPWFQWCYRKFNPTLLHWVTALFSLNGLKKYTIWVYVDKNFNCSEFPHGSRDFIENSIRPFSIGPQRFYKWSWKIRNLSLCRKIFEHCHLVQNFPRFQGCYRKFNQTLRWATAFILLQMVLENTQFDCT